jgi:hypothetical protein
MPLGEPHRGECAAGAGWLPEGDLLRERCNFGYARGRCDRFPAGAEADAVRFTAWEERDGVLELEYILERDYAPLRNGQLRYRSADGRADGPGAPDIVLRQAEAFAGSHLRRKGHTAWTTI